MAKKRIKKFDPDFRFLLDLDPALEEWRALTAEYWQVCPSTDIKNRKAALTAFLVDYLHAQQLHLFPVAALFEKSRILPKADEALGLASMKSNADRKHDYVSDFLDWILRYKLAEPDANGVLMVPEQLASPFLRQRSKTVKFDSDFRFLLDLDPALEEWRALTAEYWQVCPSTDIKNRKAALTAFLVDYLHAQQLHLFPVAALFEKSRILPKADEALGLASMKNKRDADRKHDYVSDFLDWILREKLAVPDTDGHLIVPAQLANPFPRRAGKMIGKTSDLTFAHVRASDPRMEDWCDLAEEWLKNQKTGVADRRDALDRFLTRYIIDQKLGRNFGQFLLRSTVKPDFADVLAGGKKRGEEVLSREKIKFVNYISSFLEWVLENRLGDPETGMWDRARFHNPVQSLSAKGIPINSQSDKAALSILYIRELRGMLAEGRHFRDWRWAQTAIGESVGRGDWFLADPKRIDPKDPDCVFRRRTATEYEIKKKGYPAEICELWSPVRAVALHLKLLLPLRTYQVRMLDSGEADTWRYEHGPAGGGFVRNQGHLSFGSEKRPYQRGVFHRSVNEQEAGLYINSNKTADANKTENEKGYVIPWSEPEVLYWLDKLRNWQERYNPIVAPTQWADLERKHFGRIPPHPDVLAERVSACFLFRDPTEGKGDRPIVDSSIRLLWYRLLERLEQRCADRGETLNDGAPLRFVEEGSKTNTLFPLHALRVSLISYFVLDLKLPIAIVSKMIAGHATIIMTLYYTKFGKAYMREVMSELEKNELEADQANHRRFLSESTFEQIGQRFAFTSEDAPKAAAAVRSAASFVFDDKGICPNGATMCDVGGEALRPDSNNSDYAPVPGFPQDRNCVLCRFFITGPAYLPGLVAHFNTVSEKLRRQSERHAALDEELRRLERCKHEAEAEDRPFLLAKDLAQISKQAESEAIALQNLVNVLQATNHLIHRSIEIAETEKDGLPLVAKGSISDLKTGFIETQSVLHQLEVVCENAVVYPGIDAGHATLRRSQMLDAMLDYNGMKPVMMHLTEKQQLLVGNAVMQLIQVRTGSIKDSLPYAECRRKLQEIGLDRDQVLKEINDVAEGHLVGHPGKTLIDHTKNKPALIPTMEVSDAD